MEIKELLDRSGIHRSEVVTLRIKRKWFEEIQAGRKRIEYRDFKKFYQKCLEPAPKFAIFHYQNKAHRLICKVSKIETTNLPAELIHNKDCISTPLVYAIHLDEIRNF